VAIHCGSFVAVVACAAAIAGSLRIARRLATDNLVAGTPTNEMTRQLALLTVTATLFGLSPGPFCTVACAFHAATLIAPWPVTHVLRSQAHSPTAILGVNALFSVVVLVSFLSPLLTLVFVGAYTFAVLIGLPEAEMPE
jgi:hypothetical protein